MTAGSAIALRGKETQMLRRSCMLCMMTALVCGAAEADEPAARPDEVAGWGRVVDPSGDCDVALDRVQERLRIEVPGTAHVLSPKSPGSR